MSAAEWNALPRTQQEDHIAARKRSGHTSAGECERIIRLDARADAFNEACDFLAAKGFTEAAAALDEAAFEK